MGNSYYLEPGDNLGNGFFYFPEGTKVEEPYREIIREFKGRISAREVETAFIGVIRPKKVDEIDVDSEEIEKLESEELIEIDEDDGEEIQFTDELSEILK